MRANASSIEEVPTIDTWAHFKDASEKTGGLFDEHQIEWLFRTKDQNGLGKAFRKLGGKKYFNVRILEQLMAEG